MSATIPGRERERVALQEKLDSKKDQAQRNKLGQFATPTALARDILQHAKTLLPAEARIRFLDPAIGTGSFYSALLHVFPEDRIEHAAGFEIDKHYGQPAQELWQDTPLSLTIADFTRAHPEAQFNLLVCNPPYVRHHHMTNGNKGRLQLRTMKSSGMKLSGLAGLYGHFIGLSHAWLAPDAISCWLVPSEFMDVNYGQAIKRYLLDRVTLLHIHRFDPDDVQFADALVSSAIVCFRNAPPPADHSIIFTFGGTLTAPKLTKTVTAKALAIERKWTRFPASDIRNPAGIPTIADFFRIKRGLATGDNSYFILSAEEVKERQLPMRCFKPILPSPRYLTTDEITADQDGLPCIDRRMFLLDPDLPEDDIKERYPTLAAYLAEGKKRGLHERYLCKHRAVWYGQESRPPPPIICTYLGRSDNKSGRPFRFILNESKATVVNVYLAMYPTPTLADAMKNDCELIREIWRQLNRISADKLLGEGRVYGGGLHKLEPKELANVPVPEIAVVLEESRRTHGAGSQ